MAWRTTRTEGGKAPPPRKGDRWPAARPRRSALAALRGTALSDNRDLIGGVLGAAFVPAASIGLGVPLWISIPCAVGLYFGVRALLRPRALFDEVDTKTIDVAKLRDCDPQLTTLRNLNRPEDYQAALESAGGRAKRFGQSDTPGANTVSTASANPFSA